MKITVFGTGYVGLVTGACLADTGHEVLCVDVDPAKVDAEFFAGTPIKSNFLCNIGYGDLEGIKGPRLHRYDFDKVCSII